MIVTILVFIGSIFVLAGVHELGHFLAAKASGVYVNEFAIGFGPRLWGRRFGETLYSVRVFPIGGYVRMAGEDRQETDASIPADKTLYSKPPYIRALISFAGPFANLACAFLIALAVIWGAGFPMQQVAGLIPDTPAAEALTPGDRVLSIDGGRILEMQDITDAIQAAEGAPMSVEILRGDEPMTLSIAADYAEDESRWVIGAYFLPAAYTNEIAVLNPAAPFRLLGIQAGDRITAVNGKAIETAVDLLVAFEGRTGRATGILTVERAGEQFDVDLARAETTIDLLFTGIMFADLGATTYRPGFATGLRLGAEEFAANIVLLASWVRQLIGGEISVGESVSGPIGIAQLLGQGVRMGAPVFFSLLVFLSINFGLFNLIPFPALDGSRIVFAVYEWIRRKPIPPEREGLIHTIGFLILLGLMVLITYKDIVRFFG